MNAKENKLGGRLPLLTPADLTAEQHNFYEATRVHVLPWAEKMGFAAITADEQLIGPFNAMLRSPLISAARSAFVAAEREHTALSPNVREVIILTVGAIWNAAYELYAHRAVGTHVGLKQEVVEALALGNPTEGLTAEERLAHDFVRVLVMQRSIGEDQYNAAVKAFGEKGVVDMIYLAGNYVTVSMLLTTFTVPVPVTEDAS